MLDSSVISTSFLINSKSFKQRRSKTFQSMLVTNRVSKFQHHITMKLIPRLIVLAFIACATATSDEDSSSSSEETQSSVSLENPTSSSEDSESSSDSESLECEISYSYTIWIGDYVDVVHSINLQSKCGIVFLDAMRQASEKKEQFAFEYTSHPLFGAFVTQINGLANDGEVSTYWMIYDLTSKPDVDNVPDDEHLSSVGVSSLEVLDGHSYLFWYKTVTASDDDYN